MNFCLKALFIYLKERASNTCNDLLIILFPGTPNLAMQGIQNLSSLFHHVSSVLFLSLQHSVHTAYY